MIFCVRGVKGRFRRLIHQNVTFLKLNIDFVKCFSTNNNNNSPKRLTSEIYSIPNLITISRIAASPLITLAIVFDFKEIALYGCIFAAFSDWLDGYIAKNYNQSTSLGAVLDPLADKVFIGSITVGLTIQGLIPIPLASLIIGRDLSLMMGAIYMRLKEKDSTAPFFDTSATATFEISPTRLSKFNTGLQFLLLIHTLGEFIFGYPLQIILLNDWSILQFGLSLKELLWWLTGTATVTSGLDYMSGSGLRRITKQAIENVIRKKIK